MKRKVFLAISVSLLIGVLLQIYIGDFKNEPDFVNQIASLIGGGIGFLIAVIILPLVVSLITMVKNKKFPSDTFTTMTYILLIILGLIMFIGQWNIKSMASNQQDGVENLRNQLKAECVKVTASVYDLVEPSEKEEMKKISHEYCECLYDKVSREDLIRVLEKKILVPELLNIEYKSQQDVCFQDKFRGIDTMSFSDQMETDNEKIAFWSSRLVSYYLMTYGEFKSEYLTKVLDCFTSVFNESYSNMISEWETRDLTTTEIFKEKPMMKKAIEDCYNKLK